MTINKLAIIGEPYSSGLYDVEEFKERELLNLNTPWGKPSDQILKTIYKNKESILFTKAWKGALRFTFKYKFQSKHRCT